ncbi:unnamed protein product [Mytilus edulis]|uniref:CCHC-type domain-containing protein n=1 Tax=Mytilus edulis TaxID=6550 RepID=A0A8S3UBX7_MYTED|nr:unnamed protein product [Mytilus edulis]
MSDIEPDNLLNDIQPEVASHASVPNEEISNADLLSLMQNYFGTTLSGLKEISLTLLRIYPRTSQRQTKAVKKMKVTKGSSRRLQKRPAEAAGGQSSVARGADGVTTVSQPPFFVGGASGPNSRFIRLISYKCGLYGHWAKECKNGGNSNFPAPRGSSA